MSNKSDAIPGDAVVAHAARALAAGDPLGALNLVALRDDGPGLALRGIAMAQLGDLGRARALLKSASRAFGPGDSLARARCVLAEAEIALATRDLSVTPKTLDDVRATLERHGDHRNSAHARFISARRLLLIGQPTDAEQVIAEIDPAPFPPAMRAAYELVVAGIAIRRLRASEARRALEIAAQATRHAGIPALAAEVESAFRILETPAALVIRGGERRLILLNDVEALLVSDALIVDACRYTVRNTQTAVSLAGRPVLFALARALGEAWPDDVPRNTLIKRAFDMLIDDTEDRLRLRVEIGRLRAQLEPLAAVIATKRGFALVPHRTHQLVVLEPPAPTPPFPGGERGPGGEAWQAVLALLADGETWSSSGLALALGIGQRSVQRALEALEASGKVQVCGRGRACRWMAAPVIGISTTLLLPGSLPGE